MQGGLSRPLDNIEGHHTAKRIFCRLREEYGSTGGITQVKEAVARHKRHAQEVFVPLSHPVGRRKLELRP
jgi:hypothetical protein